MTTEKPYMPSEDDVRLIYVAAWVEQSDYLTRHQEREADRAGEDAWDRFIAKVKRDAAREALDGLADHEAALHSRDPEAYAECLHVVVSAKSWRETHYRIEETP